MGFHSDDISINTIIGVGSSVTGNLKVNGFVRVDGDIDGDLETTGKVITNKYSRVRGNITAASVIAGGIVEGDIVAPERIQLLATSAVYGDLSTRRLEIDENVVFHGYCIALKDQDTYSEAEKNRADSKIFRERSFFSSDKRETDGTD